MQPANWTLERVETLRVLWARGLSANQCANELGHVTRSAVIGKVHRLGLPARTPRCVDPAEIERRQLAERIRTTNAQRIRRALVRGEKPPVLIAAPPPAPFEGSLNLLFGDLRPRSADRVNQCRFPEGDGPEFSYCGTDTLPGSSWCAHHRKIVCGPQEGRTFKATASSRGVGATNFSRSVEVA